MALPGKQRLSASVGESEFGGKPGLIQKVEDGHEMSIGEQAMVLRHHNLRGGVDNDVLFESDDVTISNSGKVAGLSVAARVVDVDKKRDEVAARLNGRYPEDVTDVETLA